MNRAGWIAIGGLAAVQALLVVLVARGGSSSDLPAPRARDVAGQGSARPRAVTRGSAAPSSDGTPSTRGCGDVVTVDGQPNAYQSVLIVGGDTRGTLHVGAIEPDLGARDCAIVFASSRKSVPTCRVTTPSGARLLIDVAADRVTVHGVVSGQDLIYECSP